MFKKYSLNDMRVQPLLSVLIIQALLLIFSNAIKGLSSNLRKNTFQIHPLRYNVFKHPSHPQSWYEDGGAL